MRTKTACIRLGNTGSGTGRPLTPPIVASSTFVFDDQDAVDRYYGSGAGYLYSRNEDPTVRAVETGLAGLERAEAAACFGSGMAAISTTLLAHLAAGDRVAAQREIYPRRPRPSAVVFAGR